MKYNRQFCICWFLIESLIVTKCSHLSAIVESNYFHQHFRPQNTGKGIMLGDPEVTANIYCKSRNLPNTDTQNQSTDLRYPLDHPAFIHKETQIGFLNALKSDYLLSFFHGTYIRQQYSNSWLTQKLPQICTVISRIRIGKVA